MLNKYVIIRTYSAGVHAGILTTVENDVVTLKDARRIWHWEGASTLSELAIHGTSNPENCKFPCEVDEIKLFNVIEIIPCSEKAIKSIKNVEVWSTH